MLFDKGTWKANTPLIGSCFYHFWFKFKFFRNGTFYWVPDPQTLYSSKIGPVEVVIFHNTQVFWQRKKQSLAGLPINNQTKASHGQFKIFTANHLHYQSFNKTYSEFRLSIKLTSYLERHFRHNYELKIKTFTRTVLTIVLEHSRHHDWGQ